LKFRVPINAFTNNGAISNSKCGELKVYTEHSKSAVEVLTK